MAQQSEYVFHDLTFLSPDIALLRSKTIVEGQLRADGEPMGDRHNDHLRVFQRRDGRWVIVSHLISQANKKVSQANKKR
jgi:ketosteroid isomerase-like protein